MDHSTLNSWYHQWSDSDCLFALSLTLEGTTLRYFEILRRRDTSLSFGEVEERFCRNLLRAASQLHCPEAR